MQFKNFIKSFRKLIRLNGSLISALISAILAFFYLNDVVNSILVGLAILSTITFGFAINDYFDFEKDNIYPEKHVIASGEMSRQQVGFIASLLFLLSAIITLFLNPLQQIINSLLLLILSVYSHINNRYGILANGLVALCSSLSILIAQREIGSSLLTYSSVSVFFFIFSREIIKDIHDVDADCTVGKTSIPIRFTIRISFLFAFLLTLISFLFCVFSSLVFHSWNYLIIITIAHLFYLFFLVKYMTGMSEKQYKQFSKYSKISFLLLVPALIISQL